jgi:hypothetical protein
VRTSTLAANRWSWKRVSGPSPGTAPAPRGARSLSSLGQMLAARLKVREAHEDDAAAIGGSDEAELLRRARPCHCAVDRHPSSSRRCRLVTLGTSRSVVRWVGPRLGLLSDRPHRAFVFDSSPSSRLRHGGHSHHLGESPGTMDGCRTKLRRHRPHFVTRSGS